MEVLPLVGFPVLFQILLMLVYNSQINVENLERFWYPLFILDGTKGTYKKYDSNKSSLCIIDNIFFKKSYI